MSNNGAMNAVRQQPKTVELPCSECGGMLKVNMPDNIKFVNSREISLLVVIHEDPVVCEQCGAIFCFSLNRQTDPLLDLIFVSKPKNQIVTPYLT